MKAQNCNELFKGDFKLKSDVGFEELTKTLILGKLKGQDAINLYFAKETEPGIKNAIILYTSRETLIEIFKFEENNNFIRNIKERLGQLTVDEARNILFYSEENEEKIQYLIEFLDSKSLLKYLQTKDIVWTLLNPFITNSVVDKFLKLEITQEIADEFLSLDINFREDLIDFLLLKASKKALIKCLVDEKRFSENELLKIKNFIILDEANYEEADAILNEYRIVDSEIIKYAIEFASKETLLKYYPKQVDSKIVDACLKKLKELM